MVPLADDGVPLFYVTVVMLSLSWVFAAARIAVRTWKRNLGKDDWLMCAGLVLYSVTASLVIVCCFHGAGQRRVALSTADIQKGTKLFFIAQFFYSACTVPIKCSICVMMLRICDARRRFVWYIWANITLTILAAIIFIIATANICHPITTLWGETTTGTCNLSLNSSIGFFFSAISIITDWSLAILPCVLLWNVQMKPRVKLSVMLMLSLGVFASTATIVRLRYLTLYNDPLEFMYSTGAIGMWSILEEGIGIIAGSMPALRPLLSLPLFSRGSYGTGDGSHPLPSHKGSSNLPGLRGQHHKSMGSVELRGLQTRVTTDIGYQPTQRSRKSSDDDGDSQKCILKETQVTVTSEIRNTQNATT